MYGRPNRRNGAAFSISSGLLWTGLQFKASVGLQGPAFYKIIYHLAVAHLYN